MKAKVIKKIIQELYHYVIAYFTSFLLPILKETLEETKEYFLASLKEKIREEAHRYFQEALDGINTYFNTAGYSFVENLITDFLFSKIKLPFLFKPAKYIAKSYVKKEIRKFVSDKLEKLNKLDTKI